MDGIMTSPTGLLVPGNAHSTFTRCHPLAASLLLCPDCAASDAHNSHSDLFYPAMVTKTHCLFAKKKKGSNYRGKPRWSLSFLSLRSGSITLGCHLLGVASKAEFSIAPIHPKLPVFIAIRYRSVPRARK